MNNAADDYEFRTNTLLVAFVLAVVGMLAAALWVNTEGGSVTDYYTQWCERNNVTHGHCPRLCEHPQPFAIVLHGETLPRLICGRCWCVEQVVTEMVPCGPGVCE